MITKNTKKILNYLLRNLELKNINQISKELKISVGSGFKILKELEKKEFILMESLGNAKYYKINFGNSEVVKILELILIEETRELRGYSGIYAKEFEKFDCPLIILFGSILRANKFNDVDVLFVGCSVKKVSKFCLEISKIKSKPVVPLILTKEDLIGELKKKKDSILEVVKTGVILNGEDIFIEVIKNAKI